MGRKIRGSFGFAVQIKGTVCQSLNMIDKTKIKVVKKAEIDHVSPKRRAKRHARKHAREMVHTVTGWVSDVKHRKQRETKAAFDLLFKGGPSPSES